MGNDSIERIWAEAPLLLPFVEVNVVSNHHDLLGGHHRPPEHLIGHPPRPLLPASGRYLQAVNIDRAGWAAPCVGQHGLHGP